MLVGVDNWERTSAQPVLIDAIVHTDVSRAGKSDHLPHSLHYGILTKALEKHCAVAHYRSLEALAVSSAFPEISADFTLTNQLASRTV
jgi:dihydroneopterin aldolase / 2-amino-4-hydroxy-6-hydroxymethyldihydropteridine diphosphokinase / dihydropteroate synthase